MPKVYEAWEESEDDSVSLFEKGSGGERHLKKDSKFLYSFQAGTFEEALAIHYLRQGLGPYTPPGEPDECIRCGSIYYPDGSGDCWKCADILVPKKKGKK